jgi:CheY-like chemotaxis protein
MGRSQILHVDDDPNDVLLVRQACRKAGLNCEWQALNDGDEAIAYFQGADKFADRDQYPLPNLVLLDLKMARLSGFDVLAWLRQDAKWHSLPVVVLTSSNQEADVQRAYSLGANSYLVKPVDFEKLVEIVQAVHHYWLNFNVLPDAHLPS